MARYNRQLSGAGITKALGQMVGLLLSLYVFNEIVVAVSPSFWDCTNATHVLINNSLSAGSCCHSALAGSCEGTNASVAITAISHFSTAVEFVGNLFPVIGILGAFEIIYSALQRAGMV